MSSLPRSRSDFTIAIICALSIEAEMVEAVLETKWSNQELPLGKASGDPNTYTLGRLGRHNVVLTYMPGMGSISASVAKAIRTSFTNIKLALVTGICGVPPKHPETREDIMLGDCMISTSIIQYNMGKQYPGSFLRRNDKKDTMEITSPEIRALLAKLKIPNNREEVEIRMKHHFDTIADKNPKATSPGRERDRLYNPTYVHTHEPRCGRCLQGVDVCQNDCETIGCSAEQLISRSRTLTTGSDTQRIHFGRFGSANTVMKSGADRDRTSQKDCIVAFEMEGSGVWGYIPTIIIKAACDYADSHKNKVWQPFAAAIGAAGMAAILESWHPADSLKHGPRSNKIFFGKPSIRLAHFVNRPDISDRLEAWLVSDSATKTIVLHGMGGAGKSQLALEVCARAITTKQFSTILWIDATSPATAAASAKVLALELTNNHDISDNLDENMQRINMALEHREQLYLVVFDSFDNPASFNPNHISRYYPLNERGKILFTSRHGSSHRLGQTIEVGGMTESESLNVLKINTTSHEDTEAGLLVAARLGYLALTMDQASAYMRARRIRPQDFLHHFETQRQKILEELPDIWEYRRAASDEDTQTLLSSFTTWELSLSQLPGDKATRRFKEQFLSICARFHRNSISSIYFHHYAKCMANNAASVKHNESHSSDSPADSAADSWLAIFMSDNEWDDTRLQKVVEELVNLSLVQESTSETSIFVLHPVIREWLNLRSDLQAHTKTIDTFTAILTGFTGFTALHSARSSMTGLLLNIDTCLQEDRRFLHHSENNSSYPIHAAWLFCGIYASVWRATDVVRLAEAAIAACQSQANSSSEDKWNLVRILLRVYMQQNRYEKSQDLVNITIEDMMNDKRIEGEQVWKAALELAEMWSDWGRHEKAANLIETVVALYHGKPISMDFALDMLQTQAKVCARTGKLTQAIKIYEQALGHAMLQPGERGMVVGYITAALGKLYAISGRHAKAEKLKVRAIEILERVMGDQHTILALKGNYIEARNLYERVITTTTGGTNVEHDFVQTAKELLADVNTLLLCEKRLRFRERLRMKWPIWHINNRSSVPDTVTSEEEST